MPHDRYAWTLETARALRAGDFARVDAVAVAEELEQVGRSDVRELKSRIIEIMEHLLKLQLTTGLLREYKEGGWQASIIRQRDELRSLFAESPSLKRKLTNDFLAECYATAAATVAAEYHVKPQSDCPFTLTGVLPKR